MNKRSKDPNTGKRLSTTKRQQIEYCIMRLLFINPVSLPVMTESYLRKDFHFALYLSYCYGKVLSNFFKFSLWLLLIALFLCITLNITVDAIPNEDAKLYLNLTLFVIALITLVLLKSCLTSAEKKLTPNVYRLDGSLRDLSTMNLKFNERQGGIDPFIQNKELPRMLYLDIDSKNHELTNQEYQQLNNDEDRQQLIDRSRQLESIAGGVVSQNLHNYYNNNAHKFITKDAFGVNNRHESLFCCGRRGVNYLILHTAQFLFTLTIGAFCFRLI